MSGHHHHFHTDGATDYYIYRRTFGKGGGSGVGCWTLVAFVLIVGGLLDGELERELGDLWHDFEWWIAGTVWPWMLHSGMLPTLIIVVLAVVGGRRMLTAHSLRQADEAWAAYYSGARRLSQDRPSAADLQQLEHDTAQQIASIRDQANLQAKRDRLFAEEMAQLQAMNPTQPPSPLETERAAHRANLRAIGAPCPPRPVARRATGKDKKA